MERWAAYKPGSMHLVDEVIGGPEGRTSVYNLTLEEIRERDGDDVVIIPLDEAHELAKSARRAKYLRPVPVEIDEEKYRERLEVLPPMRWQWDSNGETFMLCEMLCDNLTEICAKIGDRYFTFQDSKDLTHREILKRCFEAMNKAA